MPDPVVLCVDDEESVLRAICRELRNESLEVITASSGQEGLDRLIDQEVAVVISDMRMPVMTGVDFLSQVREIWPDAYRILLTGYADIETVTSAVNQGGIHRYLVKPWDAQVLRTTVLEGVERNRLLKENVSSKDELEARNKDLESLNRSLEEKVNARTKELELVYRELGQSEKLSTIGRLAAGVVHEALNPLTVAVASIDLMQMEGTLSEKQVKSLDMAQEGVQQAARIMGNLRNFSRQGNQSFGPVDLRPLLSRTRELLKFEMRKRNIKSEVLCDMEPVVMGDRDRLGQVFLNLAKNAIEAMENRGELTLGCESGGGDGKWIAVYVKDTGPGIPEEIRPHLFEPFHTSKEDGTGLGLSICKDIVEEHGGEIKVETLEGKGTCFWVILPTSEGESE